MLDGIASALSYRPEIIMENYSEMKNLLSLLNTQSTSSAYECNHDKNEACPTTDFTDEFQVLSMFCSKYETCRHFSQHGDAAMCNKVFISLVERRVMNRAWMTYAPPANVLQVLMCLRILLRDKTNLKKLAEMEGLSGGLCGLQKCFTEKYLTQENNQTTLNILKEIINIFYKLSTTSACRHVDALIVNEHLVMLLAANDLGLFHRVLRLLISVSKSSEARRSIVKLESTVEKVLHILQDYDVLSKELAAQLLRCLAAETEAKDVIKAYGGISLLFGLLQCDCLRLVWNITWCLVVLSSDSEISNDIRLLGGIPILLSMLHDTRFATSGSSIHAESEKIKKSVNVTDMESMTRAFGGCLQTELAGDISLKSACCACLTELVVNDANTHQVVQSNGIYQLSLLVLPPRREATKDEKRYSALVNLQANALRCLRFIFSFERTRRHFKRLFPSKVFESFIDIGHYNHDITAYTELAKTVNSLPVSILEEIQTNVENSNLNKTASRCIGDYEVMEVLGSGAFGTVYKVRKRAGPSFLALKEISTVSALWGHNSRERQASVGDAINELSIIREQLKHPNIVKYFKTFVLDDKLYIVMDLIDGVTLGEHVASLKEKKEKFTESQIWKIFMQLLLALRYLHKEKGIVHRDLTPNNVMLDESCKVTITDFGLAKQKRADSSKMNSVVGTILCSCPELIQNLPYGEKADIWGLGCLLYQMCTLNLPFYSSNMLTLASKIVNAEYETDPLSDFTPLIASTIRICLTPKEAQRPDIVGVAGHVADVLLSHMDATQQDSIHLERKLERAWKRTQKHSSEVNASLAKYHSLNREPNESRSRSIENSQAGLQLEGVESDVVRNETSPSSSERFGSALSHKSVLSRPQSLSVMNLTQSAQCLITAGNTSPSMVAIAPCKMRQINDPVVQILEQVHHLVYLSQLPPTVHSGPRRRLVDYFKRTLFAPCSTPTNLKKQLLKLLTDSRDTVELPSEVVTKFLTQINTEKEVASAANYKAGEDYELEMIADVDLTYEQLRTIIDGLLVESGYYHDSQRSSAMVQQSAKSTDPEC